MSFDADKFQAALRPWIFTAGRSSWIARPVSAPALARFHGDFKVVGDFEREQLLTATSPLARARVQRRAERRRAVLLRRIFRVAFPYRLSYLVRGDPVKALIQLPPAARSEAITAFFQFAEGKPKSSAPPTSPPIPGTPSNAPSATT